MLTIRRWMARYLRKHGWVVFYLPEESRTCNKLCWLEIYKNDLKKGYYDD